MPQITDGPQNIPYERSVLGTALWSEEGMRNVLDQLKIDDFSLPAHRMLFQTMQTITNEGFTPTFDVLEHKLRQAGALEQLGDETTSGIAYLHALHESSALISNLPHYVASLRTCAGGRQMMATGLDLIEQGRSLHADDFELLALSVGSAQERIWELSEATVPQNFETIGQIITEGYEEIINGPAEVEVVPTGFIDLDRKLHGGLKPKQVCVVAARPAVGKSVFGLNVAAYASIHKGIPSVFYSLEMTRTELATRLIANQARVPLDRLQEGKINEHDDEKIRNKIGEIIEAPLYIDDTPGLDVATLTSSIRFMRRRFGVRLVVLDYLQLVKGRPGEKSRQEEVSNVSRQLKIVAKQEDVAIIAIAQLNRGPEQRGGKPQISDLRESGSIEQDADIVILLHREDLYDPESGRAGEADFIVAKQRSGTSGAVPVAFQGHYGMFSDMHIP